jgi:hypothetical protein
MMSQKGLIMVQIHKKFTFGQVKVWFISYKAGYIHRSEIENTLNQFLTSIERCYRLLQDRIVRSR